MPHEIWEYLRGYKRKYPKRVSWYITTRWNNWGLGFKAYVLLFQRMWTINLMIGPWEITLHYCTGNGQPRFRSEP
jgi:hypothetical protein